MQRVPQQSSKHRREVTVAPGIFRTPYFHIDFYRSASHYSSILCWQKETKNKLHSMEQVLCSTLEPQRPRGTPLILPYWPKGLWRAQSGISDLGGCSLGRRRTYPVVHPGGEKHTSRSYWCRWRRKPQLIGLTLRLTPQCPPPRGVLQALGLPQGLLTSREGSEQSHRSIAWGGPKPHPPFCPSSPPYLIKKVPYLFVGTFVWCPRPDHGWGNEV